MPAHRPERPLARRRRRRATVVAAVVVAAAGPALAACDTGDGKTLSEPAVAFTTTVPPPETLASVPLEAVPVVPEGPPSLPIDDANTTPQAFQAFAPWQQGAAIDAIYTCDGENISPAVSWLSPPAGTVEVAIALVDDSALDGDSPFVHWVVAGIDPNDITVLEGDVPLGSVQAVNSFGSVGYDGPCPPEGDEAHVYRLTVYALNQQNELADGTSAASLLEFIEDVAIGSAGLTGTYRR